MILSDTDITPFHLLNVILRLYFLITVGYWKTCKFFLYETGTVKCHLSQWKFDALRKVVSRSWPIIIHCHRHVSVYKIYWKLYNHFYCPKMKAHIINYSNNVIGKRKLVVRFLNLLFKCFTRYSSIGLNRFFHPRDLCYNGYLYIINNVNTFIKIGLVEITVKYTL